jgi:hypothetical protein
VPRSDHEDAPLPLGSVAVGAVDPELAVKPSKSIDARSSGMMSARMKVFRQFAALVLLLTLCISSAMACMVPGAKMSMSAQERACCRMMKDQCGQMEMPGSHGCCQKTPQSVYINAPATKTEMVHTFAVTAIWLTALELVNPTAIDARWVDRPEYSPPKSPPSTVSILRI